MFSAIPEVVPGLPAIGQCWQEAVSRPTSAAQTGWTKQQEKDRAGSLHGWTAEESCQSKYW